MTVLIIDDDAEDTELFCDAFHELFPDALCEIANSCKKIETAVNSIHPDIIFMDGHMFPTSGKECLKKLNEHVDRKRIKVIVHSGSLTPNEVDDFNAMGIDGVMIKASSFSQLKSNLVNIIVDRYQLAPRP